MDCATLPYLSLSLSSTERRTGNMFLRLVLALLHFGIRQWWFISCSQGCQTCCSRIVWKVWWVTPSLWVLDVCISHPVGSWCSFELSPTNRECISCPLRVVVEVVALPAPVDPNTRGMVSAKLLGGLGRPSFFCPEGSFWTRTTRNRFVA